MLNPSNAIVKAGIAVVGGGPAGSTAARLLAKERDVLLLEEHAVPGEPLQCAGLVTPRGVPRFAEGCVIASVRGAKIHSPLGFELMLEAKEPRALVLDRRRFDRLLFEKAVDAGAIPHAGCKVESLGRVADAYELKVIGLHPSPKARIVIGADGYKSVVRRSAGFRAPRHMLNGIQVDLTGVEMDDDFVQLFIGREVAPGFFAWAVPAGDVVRVGLCTWDAEHPPAVYLKKLLRRPEFRNGQRTDSSSGKIPIGPGKSAVSEGLVLVGDAACHAKPLSGGGVFTGIRGAELCAHAVSDALDADDLGALRAYDDLWKDAFGKELARAFRIRKVFLALSDKKMDKALRMFSDPEMLALIQERGDIDYPASLASSVVKLAPKLAQFSPQLIESLL